MIPVLENCRLPHARYSGETTASASLAIALTVSAGQLLTIERRRCYDVWATIATSDPMPWAASWKSPWANLSGAAATIFASAELSSARLSAYSGLASFCGSIDMRFG
jgi:hypothetical protein